MRIAKFTLVAMLLMAAFVSAINCGKTTENTQLQTYSGHGFSFKYPKTFGVDADKFYDAEENSAMVSVSRLDITTYESESFFVSYKQGDSGTTDLNQCLDRWVTGREEGMAFLNETYLWSPVMDTTHAGHRVIYKLYTLTSNVDSSISFHGALAAFFCDKSNRIFTLETRNNTTHDWITASDDFMNYLDSFVCH
jgi:hypothetical protein